MKETIKKNKGTLSIVTATALIIAATQFISLVDKLASKYVLAEPSIEVLPDSNRLRGVAYAIEDTFKITKAEMVK